MRIWALTYQGRDHDDDRGCLHIVGYGTTSQDDPFIWKWFLAEHIQNFSGSSCPHAKWDSQPRHSKSHRMSQQHLVSHSQFLSLHSQVYHFKFFPQQLQFCLFPQWTLILGPRLSCSDSCHPCTPGGSLTLRPNSSGCPRAPWSVQGQPEPSTPVN